MSDHLRAQIEVKTHGEFSWNVLPISVSKTDYLEVFRTKLLPLVRPDWEPDKLGYSIFDDGITNLLVAFYPQDRKLQRDTILLRLNGAGSDKFIDRNTEILVMLALHREGLIPPIHYVLQNGMCYGFVPGMFISVPEMSDSAMMRRMSRTLSRLHAVEVPDVLRDRKPQMWAKIDEFYEKVPREFSDPVKQECFARTIGSVAVLEREIVILRESIGRCHSPIVFCHNDLLHRNVIYNKQEDSVSLIDFEYGGPNYLAFDLANHFCEFAGIDDPDYSLFPDESKQKEFIRMYLEESAKLKGQDMSSVTDDAVHELYRVVGKFALGSHMFWCLWALLQAQYSTIEFNYIEYAGMRFEEFLRRKDEFYAL